MVDTDEDDALMQQVVWPVEEMLARGYRSSGALRWFRSQNVRDLMPVLRQRGASAARSGLGAGRTVGRSSVVPFRRGLHSHHYK